jgi:two-component system, cell cycle sensor histidine kinase and response regulator CckA
VPPSSPEFLSEEHQLAVARLAAIVESSDDAIVSKRLDGTVTSWNASAERMFGYPAEEMVGYSILKLIPPELHQEEYDIIARIAAGEHVAHYETERVRKDGSRFPIDLTISPVRNAKGVIVGASSIKRDISDRRHARTAIARLAAIVQSSDDAIVSKTLEGVVVTWNPAAERMYGYSAAEIIGRPIYMVIPEHLEEEEREILRRAAEGEQVAHYETIRRRKDGTLINIALSLSPMRDHDGRIIGVASIKRDITDSKRAEAGLRQAAKMEAIGALAGGLAHDFNNELHALSGFAHFIGRDRGLSAATRQDVLEIQKTIERMASLTRQLLAFARQQVLTPETLDLNAALTDTQGMLRRLVGSNMEMTFTLGPGPKWVRVDRSQLVQILLNLVINARDAMPGGGRLVIRTETHEAAPGQVLDRALRPVEPGAYAELVVADNGKGIAPEHLPHIFEPFYTTKEVGQGTGLGLATVDGIVSQSGGHIQVESTLGRGTTIHILLPLTTEPAPATPPETSADLPTPSRASILVVDDEDSVRAVVTRTLQGQGYTVLSARNGSEAVEYLEEVGGAVDLVITDMVMPVMGGRKLTLELTERYPSLRVIWMSGHTSEREFRVEEQEREQIFLSKPVPARLLLETVGRVLQEKSSRPR